MAGKKRPPFVFSQVGNYFFSFTQLHSWNPINTVSLSGPL